MKRRVFRISLVVLCAFASDALAAHSDALTAWFMHATAYTTESVATKMSRPELLPEDPRR